MDAARRIGLASRLVGAVSALALAAALCVSALAAPPAAPKAAAAPVLGQEPELALYQDALFLLPQGNQVNATWVVPPVDKSDYSLFCVDPEGVATLARTWKPRVMNPARQYVVALARDDLMGMVQLDNGVRLFAAGNEVGLLAQPATRAVDKESGLPLAAFQPLAATPVRKVETFSSAGNTLFFSGFAPGLNRQGLYVLRTVKGSGPQDYLRVFDSKQTITAATGDEETLYVALGRAVLRVSRGDGSSSAVYSHPTQTVSGLALTPAGLFVSTGESLVLVGKTGSLEVMRSSPHRIHARGGVLYLFFLRSSGVLALDNLADLNRFNLAVRPVERGEAQAAIAISQVRFFEAGPPPYARRNFAESFPREGLRRLVAQIDYRAAGKAAQPGRHVLSLSWFEPTGGRLLVTHHAVELGPKAPGGQVLASIGQETTGGYVSRPRGVGGWTYKFGPDSLGWRYPGRYVLKAEVDGVPLGEWTFHITGRPRPIEAMSYNDPAALEQLIAQGLDLKAQDADGELPLNLAVRFGSTAMVEMLLKAGADPNLRDREGRPALALANESAPDWRAKAELLVRHKANVNAAAGKDGQPLIFSYVFGKDFPLFLLEHGADITVRDIIYKEPPAGRIGDPMTPFCTDAFLDALVKRGVNLSRVTNSYGQTPLGQAIESRNEECVERLLARKVFTHAVERKSSEGPYPSAMFYALKSLASARQESLGSTRRIVRMLQKKGADLNLGEGAAMVRWPAYLLFDSGTLEDTIERDPTALNEAFLSPVPRIQDMAMRGVVQSVRFVLTNAEDPERAHYAAERCARGIRVLEGRYKTMQQDVALAAPDSSGKTSTEKHLGVALFDRSDGGAYVQKVLPGSAAERYGLKAGDIITTVDGQAAKNAAEVAQLLGRRAAGETIRLLFLRDEPLTQPDLLLACGLAEREAGKKALGEMHLARWLEFNPDAPQAKGVRDWLGK